MDRQKGPAGAGPFWGIGCLAEAGLTGEMGILSRGIRRRKTYESKIEKAVGV